MDVLLLGAAAIVLIALTVWIVWRPAMGPESADGTDRVEEASHMLPQGDQFEDQYTSATADLSAAGIAVATSQEEATTPEVTDFQRAGEPWSQPALAREGAAALAASTEPLVLKRADKRSATPRMVSLGAAALLTLGGAAAGAWLYARWLERRNRPLNRLRRRFR
jgi:hypothetical protein